MAQVAQTLDRYDLATGGDNVREDLSDVIYNISPTEVPFQSNAGRGTSRNTYKEWQLDTLAAAANNAHIDGDEFAGDALTNAKRLGNYHQISRKDLVVSRRANIVNKAGRRSEMAYQIALAGKELRRDVETAVTMEKVAVPGAAGTAMETAGYPAWIRTNLNGGSNRTAAVLSDNTNKTGYPETLGTSGNTRGLTESSILSVCRDAYNEGGNPNVIMLGPTLKQGLSNYLFTGSGRRVATQYQDQGKNPRGGVTAVGAVDVLVTDFQVMDIVPNRFMPKGTSEANVFIMDTDYWEISFLDGYHTEEIAKIGDHSRKVLLVDWALCSKNEAASGNIMDINENTAVAA